MCGITGIVDLRGQRPIDERTLRRMNAALSHRGPDGDGFHVEPGVGFGHRRLSIIDLAGGAQPLYNEDGSVVVTYNGEIYNYRELVKELTALGHHFRTHCDTEVIVHAWEEWGVRCLDRFNGMFAFAVWDRRSKELFLARDRLGIKPLHYAFLADGCIVFGSELKAVTAHPSVDRKLDPRAIEEFFAFGYSADPRSVYEDVKKLEAGTYLLLKRGEPARAAVRYWDVALDRQPSVTAVSADVLEELRSRLKAAVAGQLVADVPLGAFLSGGIDSSAVVAMMRELSAGSILTCSIGFREPQFDESTHANLVAQLKHTDHKTEIVEASDYSLLDRLVGIYDEPYADSSAIPTYRVCELARRHVTVALSGDGGDESFIGYRRYKLFSAEERLRALLPAPLRRAVFGPLGELYPKLDWAPRVFRGKSTFQALARNSADAYLHAVSIFPEPARTRLYSESFLSDLQGYRASEVFRRYLRDKEFPDSLRMAQYLDFKTYLPCDILTKVDRASMAHSLEVRVPLLDHELVSWVAGLATRTKLRGGDGKHVFKQALHPVLPDDVLYRRKMGFAVPIDLWFRGPLRQRVAETVTGPRLKECGLFKPEQLDRLVSEHQSGRRNHKPILWSLLMLDGFLQSQQRSAAEAQPCVASSA
ncbi:MAG TPA: XrtA/PEP-CTERM system amidotransferase [Gammaproteobacteria bacterium]